MKHDAQLGHYLLRASRGKLELELHKCSFHLIFYDFDRNGVPSMRKISALVITLKMKKEKILKLEQRKLMKHKSI